MKKKPIMPTEAERILSKHSAESQFKSLVSAGCDRARLLAILELAFLTDESWPALVGMDLRRFKAAIAEIDECANLIDRLGRSELSYRAKFNLHHPRFAEVHQSPTLPDRLREYARALQSLQQKLGPKHRIWMNVWKAQLVALVLEGTGELHDREVSALIAAVLDSPRYSEKAHQAWRRDHPAYIEQEKQRLQERTAKRSNTQAF